MFRMGAGGGDIFVKHSKMGHTFFVSAKNGAYIFSFRIINNVFAYGTL